MSVIIGYQGIGKSSLVKRERGYIDLESSSFYIDGKRADDWFKPYGNIALHLSEQGYDVLTASHAPLREWLGTHNETNERVFVCYPAISLRELWIEKLEKRFIGSGLRKDYAAYANAKERYAENIAEIIADADKYGFGKIEIPDVFYDLSKILGHSLARYEDPSVYK